MCRTEPDAWRGTVVDRGRRRLVWWYPPPASELRPPLWLPDFTLISVAYYDLDAYPRPRRCARAARHVRAAFSRDPLGGIRGKTPYETRRAGREGRPRPKFLCELCFMTLKLPPCDVAWRGVRFEF